MPELIVIPLGVGDAFSKRYYSSSLAVGWGEHWLLIDCPHPLRKMLEEAAEASGIALGIECFDALALTHLHADHASGVEGFLYYSRFFLGRKPLIAAHGEVLARLWPDHLAAGMDRLITGAGEPEAMCADDYYERVVLDEETPQTIEAFSIACRKTRHHIPTTAFKIRAGTRCLAYSADTSFDESLIAWLSDADLIIHETNVGIHTPYEALVALPEELRGKMKLIHYPDTFDREASLIEPLRQGVVYRI